jgi:hypothetical protein
MELTERISLKKVAFIGQMDFTTFKQFSKDCKNDDERKIKFNILKQFCSANTKARGEVKRLYSYTQKTPLEVGGRLYCGGCIQGLQKDFRGFFVGDGVTTDIDMKNAHPVILKYLCDLNKIRCVNLSHYIENRADVLKEFGDPDEGKTLFLKAINDDKSNKKCPNTFFKDFDKECKSIQKQLSAVAEYKHIADSVPETRRHNFLGSALNRILCVFENKILQEVISVVNGRNIEIMALMFDGLLVYGDHYEDDSLLADIEKRVNDVFVGLNMKFAYKEHSTKIEMPDDFEIVDKSVRIDEDRTFEVMSAEFEKTHAKIRKGGLFIDEKVNEVVIMDKKTIVTIYENITYDKLVRNAKTDEMTIVKQTFINDWLRNNDDQRCYDEMDCYPSGVCPENVYNTWRPFRMELVKTWTDTPDAVEAVRNHILILCGNDENVASYLEAWIGQMIQYPETKTICPTLISKEGAGKGTLMTIISAMLGEKKYYETTTPSKDVFGHFNGVLKDCFLVNFDEMSKSEMAGFSGLFKSLVTNKKANINEKSVKPYTISSYHRFIITSNNEDPINSNKDDRRNLIIRSSDELIGDKPYFEKMNAFAEDTDAMKSCYEYFKSIPNLDEFNRLPMPKTEYQADIQEASVAPVERWLRDFTEKHFDDGEVKIKAGDMFNDFKDWVIDEGIEWKMTAVKFGLDMSRLKHIGGIGDSVSGRGGNYRMIDFNKLKIYFNIKDEIAPAESKCEITLGDDE